jgi:hypothetical protein
MNNLEVLFFRNFNEGRFLYRLGLSIIGTSKTVAFKLLYIVT